MEHGFEKLTIATSPITGKSRFLDLPSELRNHVYRSLFAPDTRFETTQRTTDRESRRPSDHDKNPTPTRHPVVINGSEFKYLLGILGTCRIIRHEATNFLSQNLRGTFAIMVSTNFKRIPQVVFELIETIAFAGSFNLQTKLRYIAQIPKLKKIIAGTFVVSKSRLMQDSIGSHRDADEATREILLKAHLDNLSRPGWFANNLDHRTAIRMAHETIDSHWRLFSGECPFAIIVQMYVVEDDSYYPKDPCEGLLVTFDYNHGRVESVGKKMFARLQDSEVRDPSQRCWFAPSAWMILEEGQVRRPSQWVSMANMTYKDIAA